MIGRLFSSQLRVNMASGVVTTAINGLVLLVAYPLYLHYLGYERYGVWLVLATVLSFAQLGNLGVSQAVMKLVAAEHGRGDLRAVRQYIVSAQAILILSGTVLLLFILALRSPIVALFKLSEPNARTALWLLPYIACLSVYVLLVQAVNAALSGLGRMDMANWIQLGGRLVTVVAAGGLLTRGHGVASLLIGNAAAYVSIHVASLILIRRVVPGGRLALGEVSRACMRRLLGFGGTVFAGSLVNMLLTPFNKLMLSRYVGVTAIPVYEIAYQGGMQIRQMADVGLRALMPEVSRIETSADGGRDRIRGLYRRSMRTVLVLGVPVYGLLMVAAGLLLRIWLRGRFVASLAPTFRIMLVASFISLLCVPAYYTLLGLGHAGKCLKAQMITAVASAVAILVLVTLGAELSVRYIVLASLPAFAMSTAYVLIQNRKVLRMGA